MGFGDNQVVPPSELLPLACFLKAVTLPSGPLCLWQCLILGWHLGKAIIQNRLFGTPLKVQDTNSYSLLEKTLALKRVAWEIGLYVYSGIQCPQIASYRSIGKHSTPNGVT